MIDEWRMNTRTNTSFLKLNVGDHIEVLPGIYEQEWRPAEVLKVHYTDVRKQPLSLGKYCRRYEITVKLLDCENYSTCILDEDRVRVKDDCSICHGDRGGVKGNENVVDGALMCDYCHSDLMEK